MDKYQIILFKQDPIKQLHMEMWEISVKHDFKHKPEIELEVVYGKKTRSGKVQGKNFTFKSKKIDYAIDEIFMSYAKEKKQKFLDCINEDIIYINKGHEGRIFKSIDHEWVYKVITKPKTTNVNELYDKYKVSFAYKDIKKLNKANFPVEKISTNDENFIVFKYRNDILPAKELKKWDLANILKAEFENNVFIDDNKVTNYGTRNGKTVYNDIGASFILTDSEEFKDGLIRDLYYLWKYQADKNHREIIRKQRKIDFDEHFNNPDFKEFYDYAKNGYLVVAMMATAGKRDINNSLKSISGVSKIYIASEVELKSYDNVFVNPFNNGLARNTMSGLAQLKLKYGKANVFVATIDDDDLWKKSYIPKVKEKIEEGFNFISAWMEVRDQDKRIDSYKFKKEEITVDNFVIGNCGIQGSNKVFNLDLALEAGGMPMHINSATDRAFNIELLKHKNVKVGVINSEEVILNKDTNRKRISNSPKKEEELKKFYDHYRYLIDDSKKDKINKRHEELHGIKWAISW